MDVIGVMLFGISLFLIAILVILEMKYGKYRGEMLECTPKYKIAACIALCILFAIMVTLIDRTSILPELSGYGSRILWIGLPLFAIAFYRIFLIPFHKKNEHL